MAQVITIEGERLFALKAQNNQPLDIDTFIFANVPGQDSSADIDRNETVPPVGQQVHTQIVQQAGRVNDNVVIYSTVLDSLTGPFDFNWVGLYSSVNQTLVAISHVPNVSKTITVPGAAGNTLNRNFGIEYSGIADLTGITVAPETWQLDYTSRLNGMDELTRQLAADMNGKDWFIGDGFKVVPRSTLNSFKVTAGAGYVSGLRVELAENHVLTLSSYPQFVYVDAWFDGDNNSVWKGQTAFTVTNTEMDDYIDVNGKQHYVFKLANITAADVVEDLRKPIKLINGYTYFSDVPLSEISTLDLTLYNCVVFRRINSNDSVNNILKKVTASWTSKNESGRFIDSQGNKFESITNGDWADYVSGANKEFEIIGHRGLSAIYPENTAVAFSNSIRLRQADSIETDIRESKDGVLYCFHDFSLDRVTNGTGLIKDATSAYINGLDAGSFFSTVYEGTRVLTLAEMYSLARGLNCNIWPQLNTNEIAPELQDDQVRRAVQIAKEYKLESNTYFQCFDILTIGPMIRKYSKTCGLASLLPGDTVSNFIASLNYLAGDPKAVILAGYSFWLSNPGLVADARAQGVDVGAYTLNDVSLVDSLRKIGVVKIMTDINLMGAK